MALALTSHQTQALEESTTVCLYAGQGRVIEVLYPNDENRPACEVVYSKNNASQVLWSAQNDISYCQRKAKEFIAKQESWGWRCRSEQ